MININNELPGQLIKHFISINISEKEFEFEIFYKYKKLIIIIAEIYG